MDKIVIDLSIIFFITILYYLLIGNIKLKPNIRDFKQSYRFNFNNVFSFAILITLILCLRHWDDNFRLEVKTTLIPIFLIFGLTFYNKKTKNE